MRTGDLGQRNVAFILYFVLRHRWFPSPHAFQNLSLTHAIAGNMGRFIFMLSDTVFSCYLCYNLILFLACEDVFRYKALQ